MKAGVLSSWLGVVKEAPDSWLQKLAYTSPHQCSKQELVILMVALGELDRRNRGTDQD